MSSCAHSVAALAVLAAAAAAQQFPGPPVLLADVYGPASASSDSSPEGIAAVGGATFFAAEDGVHGRELFRTLGTPRTTAMVADILPGSDGSAPSVLTSVGQRLFFFANDGVAGRQPWVSDGSAAGTRRIAVIPAPPAGITAVAAFAVGDRLVFFANDGRSGVEPWVTDGTAAGTVQLADIATGPVSSFDTRVLRSPTVHTDAQGRPVLDFAVRGTAEMEWWRTDGTVVGTRRVAALQAGQSIVLIGSTAATGGGRVVFATLGATTGPEYLIWSTDGTAAGTAVIARPTSPGPIVEPAIAFDGDAYFGGWEGQSLFATDGTAAGSRHLTVPAGGIGLSLYQFLGVAHGALWVLRANAAGGSDVLRVDRGATAAVLTGSVPVPGTGPAIRPAPAPRLGDRFAVNGEGRLFGVDVAAATAEELGRFVGSGPAATAAVSGRLTFASFRPESGVEPWVTDGTAAGTVLLRDLNTTPASGTSRRSSNPHAFARLRGRVLFGVDTPLGPGIWETDGTPAGTRAVVGGVRVLGDLVPFGDRLAFRGVTDVEETELWVTDGTAVGTRLVADLAYGNGAWSDPVAFGDEVVFIGSRGAPTPELLASDGSVVRTLTALPVGAFPQGLLRRLGDRVVALTRRTAAPPTGYVGELWVTDGTAAGTRQITAVPIQPTIPDPVVFAGRFWFFGQDPAVGIELFASDGTAAGTGSVGVLSSVGSPARPSAMTVAGGKLYVATDQELFVVDDVATAPARIPLSGGTRPIYGPFGFAEVGGRLAFLGTASNLAELWVSDGTAAGTQRVGPPPGYLLWSAVLTPAGGRFAFFRIVNLSSGFYETWVTDGTTAGTVRYGDVEIETTVAGALHAPVPQVRDGVFYVPIEDPQVGVEPFVIAVGATAETVGAGCGRGNRAPALRAATVPALGTRCALRGSTSVGGAAIVLFSPAPLGPTAVASAGRCALEVDANSFVDLPAVAVVGQQFEVGLDIPADPTLVGLLVAVQALVGPTDAPAGVDVSNGVLLSIGR